jgi:hypothetical protein
VFEAYEGQPVTGLFDNPLSGRFSLSNAGERAIDPTGGGVFASRLAPGSANVLDPKGEGRLPVELAPGDGVGYRFELTRLANALRREGYGGDVTLALEVADRASNTWRKSFGVSVDLWAYPQDP